jgi:hypothetical protein
MPYKTMFNPIQQQQGVRTSLPMQQQQSWVAVGAAAVGVVGGAINQNKASKDAKKAAAGSGGGVDIASLDQQARDLSKRNIADSIALEKQYDPSVAALREQATASLLPYAGTNNPLSSTAQTLRTDLYGDFSNAGNAQLQQSGLLSDAIARARADLALGGGLDTATRNEVTRRSAANAGAVGGGGLGLGRDLSARDLGLSSLQLGNQRLNNAAALGAQEQAFNNAQGQFGLQNTAQRLSTAGLISDLGQQDFARQFQLAQFGQSLARPETGLDPTSLVNLTTGNQNAANASAQQSAAIRAQNNNAMMGAASNLLGAGIGAYANRQQNTPTKTPATASGLPAYNGAFNQPAPTYTAPTLKY